MILATTTTKEILFIINNEKQRKAYSRRSLITIINAIVCSSLSSKRGHLLVSDFP